MMKSEYIDFIEIMEGPRLRPLNPAHVQTLKASIEEIGLQTPITLLATADGDNTILTVSAGAHRLAAMRELGMDGAECFIIYDDPDTAELWEIDENLQRAELTDAQRADHHTRREAILIRRGEARETTAHSGRNADKLSAYSKKAAADLGVDERTIRRDLARGKKIEPDVLAEVSGTSLDKGVVLDELAKAPRSQQVALLDEIRQRQESHKVNREVNKVIALTDAQLFAEWIMSRTDLNELDTIISWLEGTKPRDVIAALRREAA